MRKLKLVLKIRLSTLEPSNFSPMWELLTMAPITVNKYSNMEPITQLVDPSNHLDAWRLLMEEGPSLLLSNGATYIGSMSNGPVGVSHINLELAVEKQDIDEFATSVLETVQRIDGIVEVLFAAISTKEEHDFKHLDDNGDSLGISHWDFMDYFPGIYWFTMLGREASKYVDPVHAVQKALCRSWQLQSGARCFILNDGIRCENLKERVLVEANIAKSLNENWFFDRFHQISLGHPPAYLEFLESLCDDLDVLQKRYSTT